MGYQRLPQRLLKSLTMVTKAPVARFTHVVDAEISSQEFEEVQIQVPWGHISEMGYRNLPSLLRSFTMATKVPVARFTHAVDSDKPSPEFEEIQIKVPWGHISGKWYGPKNTRPIVGLHGWQDNAGTFDTLAPLLPSHVGFLSLDLPGHGLSSRLPDGIFYHGIDNLYLLRTIMKEYNWDKISLLAHSMCSIISFLFASIFPDKVDMVIGLDALKPHIRPDDKIPGSLKNRIENFIVADERNRVKSEPPSYTQEELIQKLHTGTGSSISRESCHYLLARNIQKSSKYPEKYFFTRDSRLKSSSYFSVPQELSLYLAKRIVIPYLFIKASNSSYYEDKKYFDEVIEVMKKNPKFEFYRVEGTHHVHLNEPEKISAIINPFINKYRPAEVVSSKL